MSWGSLMFLDTRLPISPKVNFGNSDYSGQYFLFWIWVFTTGSVFKKSVSWTYTLTCQKCHTVHYVDVLFKTNSSSLLVNIDLIKRKVNFLCGFTIWIYAPFLHGTGNWYLHWNSFFVKIAYRISVSNEIYINTK